MLLYLLIMSLFGPCCQHNPDTSLAFHIERVEDGSENTLEIRPGGEFSYQLAKTKLISIVMQFKRSERASTASVTPGSSHAFHGSDHIDESAQRDAQIQLLNLVDLESNESVRGIGACLRLLALIRGKRIMLTRLFTMVCAISLLRLAVPVQSSAFSLGTELCIVQPEMGDRQWLSQLGLSLCELRFMVAPTFFFPSLIFGKVVYSFRFSLFSMLVTRSCISTKTP